jgi:hypothetical protein
MTAGKANTGWLKAVVILLGMFGMLGIFQLQTFFPGTGFGQRVIRVAIEIAAFAVLPAVAWIWRLLGGKGISGIRWIYFFALLILGLPIIDFWLIPFIFRHPSIADPVSRFVL